MDAGLFLAGICLFSGFCYSTWPMVVRMRATRSARANRRSHHALMNPALTVDSKTSTVHLRHRASAVTGKYKGITAIDMEKKAIKKAKKAKDAQAAR